MSKSGINIHSCRVFHGFVNYGTQAGFFAKELRRQGVNALSITGFDRFDRLTDVILKHSGKNLFTKVYNVLWNTIFKIKCFFTFDIFHFYYGETLMPSQGDLFFYKFFGKKVVFHYLGFDVQLYQYSVDKYKYSNVKFVFDLTGGAKHDKTVSRRLKFETKYADLQFVCAPCYSEFVPNSIVLPLAIDVSEYQFFPKISDENEEIIIMHAPTSRDNKGTSFILDAVKQLINEGYKLKFVLVENLSHLELKENYKLCDIFIDQIVGGWYGTASIEAMAIGRPVICSIRKEYFKYIDFGSEIPIISAFPDSIYDTIKNLISNREQFADIGLNGRLFVEKVHNSEKLTEKLISFYENL